MIFDGDFIQPSCCFTVGGGEPGHAAEHAAETGPGGTPEGDH
jgi:hypothetical protein